MARKKTTTGYVSPAVQTMRTLNKLNAALGVAQGHAGSLIVVDSPFPGAKQLANSVWDELEVIRQKIARMIERNERKGGILG